MLHNTANPGVGNQLDGVSCVALACSAVGSVLSNAGQGATVAEHWDGTSWALQSAPNPSGESTALWAVSCATTTDCTAVGSSTSGSSTLTLAAEYS